MPVPCNSVSPLLDIGGVFSFIILHYGENYSIIKSTVEVFICVLFLLNVSKS
uniref:Uncharacterized protein n=1 Tax=Anguilla anguilla TaxID=7936 RepID=A0A0E9PXU0_ANGAN